VVIHFVDRRLNPGGKSLENRQRFLRRAKSLVQAAVKKSSQDRGIKEVLEGGEVSIPFDGMHEPRFRREGGTRDRVLSGNKKFVEGDILPRPDGGRGGRGSQPGEGDGEDAFRFVLNRDEFVDLFLDDLELPELTKRRLADVESDGVHRAGYTTSGSPANLSVSRTVSKALMRRGGRGRRRSRNSKPNLRIATRPGEASCWQKSPPSNRKSAGFPSSIPPTSAIGVSRRCRSQWPRRSCSV
jgi:uncharacterized protein